MEDSNGARAPSENCYGERIVSPRYMHIAPNKLAMISVALGA